MRRPPYAKDIVISRSNGARPWLVVVKMGDDYDARIMGLWKRAGVAKVWVPDDFPLEEADLGWVVGLDVLLAPFCDTTRASEFALQLWRARPATLWILDEGFTATRVQRSRGHPRVVAREPFSAWLPVRQKLDASFRHVVARAREHALLVADEPLFDDQVFEPERSRLLAA